MRLEILSLAFANSFERRDIENDVVSAVPLKENIDFENKLALSVFLEEGDIKNIVALTVSLKVRRSGTDSSWSTRASP